MSESPKHDNPEQILRTEASFCIYSSDGDSFGGEAENMEMIKEKLERSATIGENIEAEFSFAKNAMRIIEEDDEDEERAPNRFKTLNIEVQDEYISPTAEGAAGDETELTKLRKHAQYLESIGDLSGAEECYLRATQSDPKDGEILSQYAKLVWQLHRDKARASHYFGKAAEAAPQDSNVLAAYASFLWDIDDDEDEVRSSDTQVDENPVLEDSPVRDFKEDMRPSSPPLHLAMGLGIDNVVFRNFNDVDNLSREPDEGTNDEEYYRRMVEDNPQNPSVLRNYARFLHQTKGDLEGAEEYYSRGILEDPHDGQMLSLYASLVWQLHRDKHRALAFFEQAVEATPDDSVVLAAFANFLWEAEDDEEEAQRSSN